LPGWVAIVMAVKIARSFVLYQTTVTRPRQTL
jgi:hypothetical protein